MYLRSEQESKNKPTPRLFVVKLQDTQNEDKSLNGILTF